jgi:single-stranded DNA-binding protein
MNTIILTGIIGKDVDIISTAKGQFGKFSLAVKEQFLNTNNEWETKHTNWFSCFVTKEQLDEYGELLTKGSLIGVVGKLQIKQKDKVYYTSVAVKNIFEKTTAIENNKKVKEFVESLNKVGGYEPPPKSVKYEREEQDDDEVPF